MAGPPLQRSAAGFGDVLVRLAGDRPAMVVVTGADAGPASWFAEVWPERVLTVPPLHARMAVAEGVVHGGADAVVIWDGDAAFMPLLPDAGVVVVTEEADHLQQAYRAGLTVLQPGWAEDIPALVTAALELPTSVVLHLPDLDGHVLSSRPAVGPAMPGGEPRVMHRGRDGLLIGAGATAPMAAAVAEQLTGTRLRVTALDASAITAGSGLDPRLLHDHLLVGSLSAPRAEALDAVPVAGGVGPTAKRVAAVLRRLPER